MLSNDRVYSEYSYLTKPISTKELPEDELIGFAKPAGYMTIDDLLSQRFADVAPRVMDLAEAKYKVFNDYCKDNVLCAIHGVPSNSHPRVKSTQIIIHKYKSNSYALLGYVNDWKTEDKTIVVGQSTKPMFNIGLHVAELRETYANIDELQMELLSFGVTYEEFNNMFRYSSIHKYGLKK